MRRGFGLAWGVTVGLILTASGAVEAQIGFPPAIEGEIYYCPMVEPGTVEVDGFTDDGIWSMSHWEGWTNEASTIPRGDPQPPDFQDVTPEEDLEFEWSAVADDGFLYVAWRVVDDVLQNTESFQCDVWRDDSVEVYIDALADGPECEASGHCYNADDLQLTVGMENAGQEDPEALIFGGVGANPAGDGVCDFSGPHPEVMQGVVREVRNEDDEYAGWEAEVAIALETLGNNDDGTPEWFIEPTHGLCIGFNIHGQDDDVGGDRDHKLMWSLKEVTETSWRNPDAFGRLMFIDPEADSIPDCTEPAGPVTDLTCTRNLDGTVSLGWVNDPMADPAVEIRIDVDGSELLTVPGTATSTELTEDDVPLDFVDHRIDVTNSSGVAATCTVGGRLPAQPPELEDPGGEVFVACGSFVDITDGIGRLWQADELFLSPNQGATNTADFAGEGPVDNSLLDDPDVPNEILQPERWCDCTLYYELIVPPDDYEVTLYFSENCVGCVSADLGGTNADIAAARIFDVQVEGETVDAYNQADAALPPDGDGLGRTFVATQLDFSVTVAAENAGGGDDELGVLDIRIIDRGGGNPPENAAVKGIVVRRVQGHTDRIFVRGDTDGSGTLNLTDGVATLQGLFAGRSLPCLDAADADDRDGLNLTDGVFVFLYLFSGGATPPPPSPNGTMATAAECGADPTDDNIGCDEPAPYCG